MLFASPSSTCNGSHRRAASQLKPGACPRVKAGAALALAGALALSGGAARQSWAQDAARASVASLTPEQQSQGAALVGVGLEPAH